MASSFQSAIEQGQQAVALVADSLAYVEGSPADLPAEVDIALVKQLHSNLTHTVRAMELALKQSPGTIMPLDGDPKC